MTTPRHIVVVGGGITGLSAAFRLEQLATAGDEDVAITILEQADRVGGKIQSDHIEGFIVDGGADIFLANKPAAWELCDTLGITNELVETNPKTRKTFIQRNHVLHPEPMYAEEQLVTPRGGMERIVEATSAALQRTHISTGTRAATITRESHGYTVTTSAGTHITADAVAITLPAGPTALVLQSMMPQASDLLRTLPYSTTTTISAGFRVADVPQSLDGYGYLVENPPPGSVTACTWSSQKIPGRAPEGGVLMRGYIRAGHELPSETAHRRFLDELRDTLHITASPIFVRSYVWEASLAIYPSNNDARIARLQSMLEAYPGLVLAGSALYAPGIPDSIKSAFTAAESVWNILAQV